MSFYGFHLKSRLLCEDVSLHSQKSQVQTWFQPHLKKQMTAFLFESYRYATFMRWLRSVDLTTIVCYDLSTSNLLKSAVFSHQPLTLILTFRRCHLNDTHLPSSQSIYSIASTISRDIKVTNTIVMLPLESSISRCIYHACPHLQERIRCQCHLDSCCCTTRPTLTTDQDLLIHTVVLFRYWSRIFILCRVWSS